MTWVKNRQRHTFYSGSRTSVSNVSRWKSFWDFLVTQNQHHPLERGSYSKGMFQHITPTEERWREAARLSIRWVTVGLFPSQISESQSRASVAQIMWSLPQEEASENTNWTCKWWSDPLKFTELDWTFSNPPLKVGEGKRRRKIK